MLKTGLMISGLLFLIACQPQTADLGTAEDAVLAYPVATTTGGVHIETEASPTVEVEEEVPNLSLENDCRLSASSMESYDLASDVLDQGLQFRIFLPPCYGQQETRHFPVLYLIHGQTFNDDQWERLGANDFAAAGIAAGSYEPFIIVMPHDLSYAQPSIDPFREAFILELIPYVDANFRTLAEREYRAVGGLSRGASWALHFALHFPELFGAVGGHSPPVFVEDAPIMRSLLEDIPSELMPRIWLDIGEKDQQAILNSAIWFEDVLTAMSIPHEWHLFPGNHDEAYWTEHLPMYLVWYTQPWN